MAANASSAACLLASVTSFSILMRSAATNSLALLSAAVTAFCSSTTACRLTSLTASSLRNEIAMRIVIIFIGLR